MKYLVLLALLGLCVALPAPQGFNFGGSDSDVVDEDCEDDLVLPAEMGADDIFLPGMGMDDMGDESGLEEDCLDEATDDGGDALEDWDMPPVDMGADDMGDYEPAQALGDLSILRVEIKGNE